MAEPGAADKCAQTASQLVETEKETKSEHTPRDLFGSGIRLLNTFSQVCYLGQPNDT